MSAMQETEHVLKLFFFLIRALKYRGQLRDATKLCRGLCLQLKLKYGDKDTSLRLLSRCMKSHWFFRPWRSQSCAKLLRQESQYETTVAWPVSNPETARSLTSLGVFAKKEGDLQKAQQLY